MKYNYVEDKIFYHDCIETIASWNAQEALWDWKKEIWFISRNYHFVGLEQAYVKYINSWNHNR